MSYTHLSEKERCAITYLRMAAVSLREIARRLGRHHASISREIKRNSHPNDPCAVYWYGAAHHKAVNRRQTPYNFRRQGHKPLVEYVERKLRMDWPPEAIAARIKIDYPSDERMRISHETIYRWVYLVAEEGGDLHHHLRRKRTKRRKQKRYGTGRRFIAGRISIHQRPAIVAYRERFGDWEGDTLEGARGAGGLATHVERKSRYLVAAKLCDKKAATMNSQTIRAFTKLPRVMRQTLTVDNGSEFSKFKELEKKARLKVYFADPYAAWQRGTNENTNGLLRHYFPKGTDFRTITEEEIELIVKKVNNRPRKCLNYLTPHEVFFQSSRGALAI